MLIAIGFRQHSVVTGLGSLVYAAPSSFWQADEARSRLVFFHGFGGGSSAYEWSLIYPAFAYDYYPIAPDLIGWGWSDHPARAYTVDDYIDTITQFLEKTCDVPVSVVASSLTAAMVIRVAIARPELFKSLVLVAPSGISDFGEDYTRSFFAQLVSTPLLDRILYSTVLATPGGVRSFLEQRQFAQRERVSEEMVSAYLASAQQPNAEYAALSFVRGDLCFDLSRYIGQLTTPTAIIWGDKSQFTPVEVGRQLAEMNPTAVRIFEVIPDVGLTPQLEVPAVTTGLIQQFLQQLDL